jgi:hypothetical protein
MPKSLLSRIRIVYLPFDLIFGVLVALAVVNGIDPVESSRPLVVLLGLGAVRIAIDMFMIGRIFGRAGHWLAIAPAQPDPRELREIDDSLRQGPKRFTAVAMATWAAYLFVAMLILLFVDRYNAEIATRSVITVGFMASAVILGTIPFASPLMSLLSAPRSSSS